MERGRPARYERSAGVPPRTERGRPDRHERSAGVPPTNGARASRPPRTERGRPARYERSAGVPRAATVARREMFVVTVGMEFIRAKGFRCGRDARAPLGRRSVRLGGAPFGWDALKVINEVLTKLR
jgi:hypothetical protein